MARACDDCVSLPVALAVERYYFTYYMPLGSGCAALVASMSDRLVTIGVEPEFQVRDAGGYEVIRLIVPKKLESTVAFRLMEFNRHMVSQGDYRTNKT